MKKIDTPKTKCPQCQHTIDAASDPTNENNIPDEDSISVCVYCGSFNAFNKDLTLRILTDEEIFEFPSEIKAQLINMRKAIMEYLEEKKLDKNHPA